MIELEQAALGEPMTEPNRVDVVILTRNEEMHIRRAIESVRPIARCVFVVDSGSADRTVEIAESLGATALHHPFSNYANQLNWALQNLPLEAPWILRLDADEYLSSELVDEIHSKLHTLSADVSGVEIARTIVFLGRPIRHGGIRHKRHLRLFRTGHAQCEERWMDEHMQLTAGRMVRFKGSIVDENLKGLSFWTLKHDHYALREAVDLLISGEQGLRGDRGIHGQAKRNRFFKQAIYVRMPRGLRSVAYFVYRYVVRLGFLDGRPGFYFHALQALWYRLYVDARISEIQQRAGDAGRSVEDTLRDSYDIELGESKH